MDKEKEQDVLEEEVIDNEKVWSNKDLTSRAKRHGSWLNSIESWLVGVWFITILFVGVFTIKSCTVNEEFEKVSKRLDNQAELVTIESLADVDWIDNCYRWNEEDGISFACYDENVWNAPCVMSFRVIDSAEDKYGDLTNFILEIKEVCP